MLFDLDGTLIDSTAVVLRSWRRWGREFNLDLDGHSWHGRPAASVVATLLPPEQQAMGLARIQQIEISDVDDLVALPGAAQALAGCGDRASIVTSCSMPLAKARLGAVGFHAPAVLVTADQVSNGKPDPEPFLLAAQRLGVDPHRCLVVEDAPAGLSAAAAAGMTSLAVITTHERGQLVASAIVTDLSAVSFESGPDGVVLHAASPAGDSLRL